VTRIRYLQQTQVAENKINLLCNVKGKFQIFEKVYNLQHHLKAFFLETKLITSA
jgi:hypothetical protein